MNYAILLSSYRYIRRNFLMICSLSMHHSQMLATYKYSNKKLLRALESKDIIVIEELLDRVPIDIEIIKIINMYVQRYYFTLITEDVDFKLFEPLFELLFDKCNLKLLKLYMYMVVTDRHLNLIQEMKQRRYLDYNDDVKIFVRAVKDNQIKIIEYIVKDVFVKDIVHAIKIAINRRTTGYNEKAVISCEVIQYLRQYFNTDCFIFEEGSLLNHACFKGDHELVDYICKKDNITPEIATEALTYCRDNVIYQKIIRILFSYGTVIENND